MVAGILLIPLVITQVGSAAYGPWLVIAAIASYLQYSDVGVGAAIVHFGSRARSGANERSLSDYVSAGLAWNVAAAIVVVPIFSISAWLYVSSVAGEAGLDPSDVTGLVTVGAIMLGCVLIAPFSSALVGAGLLPLDRRNQGIGVLARIVGTIAACLITHDVVWVATAEMAGSVLPQIIALFGLLRRHLLQLRVSKDTLPTLRFMLNYSVKSFGVAAVGALILQAGTIIVGIFLGPSDVTYFNAAYRVYTAARQTLMWAVDPFRSALSRLFVNDAEAARRIVISLTFSSLSVATVAAGTLAFASSQIVALWLGPSVPTEAIASTLSVLLLGLIVNAAQIPLVPAGDANGRPGAFFSIQVIWLVSFLVLACALVNVVGIVGVALGLGIPLVFVTPLYLHRARRVIALQAKEWFTEAILPTLIIALPATLVATAVALIQYAVGAQPFSILTGGAFIASVAITVFFARARLPHDGIMRLLKVEL